jgi:dTDP-4-dehydrorhamnose 3,5-epimerase
MGTRILNSIIETPLTKIKCVGGDVKHAMKKADAGYSSFGEAYFSIVNFNSIKAWKMHSIMTMNLIIPSGSVGFVFFDSMTDEFKSITAGDDNYIRITVPPKIWFGFKGLNKGSNLILNIANIPHDPKEIFRKDLNEISYNWGSL